MMTLSDKEKKLREQNSIVTFFAGRSIFITGGTGFLGKTLIEKILRSCPDVREVFLLMRPKKGVPIDDRLKEIIRSPLFDKVRKERPTCFEKLIPVFGDTSFEGLGISPVERQMLIDRVSVIFHSAANVRFDENLKKDILSNTRGTRELCILAESMKNLVSFVHISTAYAHADKPEVEEIVYPPIVDWRNTIEMVETLDQYSLRTFTSKYVGQLPNTYTFSKRLSEQVISDYSTNLPCVIYRPSIVLPIIDEPLPGWLDNFNGPVSLLVVGGKGILRIVRAKPHISNDYFPVDYTIKGMIAAAWKRGIKTITQDPDVHVYNCSAYQMRRITLSEVMSIGFKCNEETPLEGIILNPSTYMTSNYLLYYTLTLLLHFLPGLIIDRILKLIGRKPMLFNVYKKVFDASIRLGKFLENEWIFYNSKMLDLILSVPLSDQESFTYDFSNIDTKKYFQNCVIGTKLYLLNEDMSRNEENKRHLNRIKVIGRIFRVCFFVLMMWIAWKVDVLSYVLAPIQPFVDGSFLNK